MLDAAAAGIASPSTEAAREHESTFRPSLLLAESAELSADGGPGGSETGGELSGGTLCPCRWYVSRGLLREWRPPRWWRVCKPCSPPLALPSSSDLPDSTLGADGSCATQRWASIRRSSSARSRESLKFSATSFARRRRRRKQQLARASSAAHETATDSSTASGQPWSRGCSGGADGAGGGGAPGGDGGVSGSSSRRVTKMSVCPPLWSVVAPNVAEPWKLPATRAPLAPSGTISMLATCWTAPDKTAQPIEPSEVTRITKR